MIGGVGETTATPGPVGTADSTAGPGRPWYRRRAVLVVAVLLVVAAVAVLTDLPHHVSRSTEMASDTTVIQEVNRDVGACSYALREALAINRAELDHSMSTADARQVPALLRDDQAACSFTDNSIFDLSDIEVPGSPSGKHLNQLVSLVTTWSTSDALGAIEDIQTLTTDPNNTTARTRLGESEALLTADRAAAQAQLTAAEKLVAAPLPALALTVVPAPAHP